jgi:hypothetical protein
MKGVGCVCKSFRSPSGGEVGVDFRFVGTVAAVGAVVEDWAVGAAVTVSVA